MNANILQRVVGVCAALLLLVWAAGVRAEIQGISGPTFNLTASEAYIPTPDGGSLLIWGYGPDGGVPQYPGPTLIVNEGDTVTINLTNQLGVPVSIIFPGQAGVSATGDAAGLMTQEAAPTGGSASYTFTASHAGTYLYQSGTRADLQVEMGLFGALIVRPAVANQAYDDPATAYDHEYLFLLSEMDPVVHDQVAAGQIAAVDMTAYHPVLWFLNGRNGPDTLSPDNLPWLPNQPYGSLTRIHPGERLLLRMIGASHDAHPFHTHGNNFDVIARDGRLLQSSAGAGVDLSYSDYTQQVQPGTTHDAIFRWTGEKLGWDIYGTEATHMAQGCNDGNGDNFDDTTYEYCPDHGKPLPVVLPELQDLTFGGFWSGSPFLGAMGNLPPGEGGLNVNGGMVYMWHSHTERELVNNDIFPGGMMTMLIVEPPSATIP